MPDISVITAAYIDGQEKLNWLVEAVESVAAQTFTDLEHILVDDASPYDLERELAEHLARHAHLRLLRASERQGPARCRNTAAALARAEALLALDADDRLPPEALAGMYPAWQADRKRVVYGDLQRLERREDGRFHEGRLFDLPDYSFERVMDLNGIIPVTALHSVDCHVAAGGWKPELDAGLEDVEKWIAAGKAGFCGFHVPTVTLLYRQHDGSRAYALRRVNRRESEMRNRIRQIHADIYQRGEYPMGCCGGGRASVAVPPTGARASMRPTTLDNYPPSEKIWVRYVAKRQASFGVVGKGTGISYQIQGHGHVFEVHVSDEAIFRRSGRGKDFLVGVPAPEGRQPEPEAPAETPPYQAPPPQLAQVLRLDEAAGGPARAAPQGPEPEPVAQITPPEIPPAPGENYSLDVLELGEAMEAMLEAEGWTVLSLAEAGPEELTPYKNIGPVRAAKIIASARQHLGLEAG